MKISALQKWVRLLMRAREMGVGDLARAAGRRQPDVSRSLNAGGSWTLDRVEDYATALGVTPADIVTPRAGIQDAYEVVLRPLSEWAGRRPRDGGISLSLRRNLR